MLKIAICDDDRGITSHLEKILENYTKQSSVQIEIEIFFDGKALIQHIEQQTTNYDLIFLDIEMEQMDGMETARRIREKNKLVLLIFVTSHTNYAIEAYSVHPFQFIVKPFDEKKVITYFQQAYEVLTSGEFYYEYKYNKIYHRIMVNDIMYFESTKRIIHIHLKDGTSKQYYDKMKSVQEKLQKSNADFWRIHQSILVNARYVVKKAFDYVELADGTILQISEDRRKELNARYIKRMIQKLED